MTAVDLVIRGGLLATMDENRRAWHNGSVAIDGAQVLAVGSSEGFEFTGRREIDAQGGMILPGLVCAHTDFQQAPLRGLAEGVHAVRDRMYRLILPFGAHSTRCRAYAGARLLLAEQLLGGVTAAGIEHYVHTRGDSIDGVCQAISESGSRAVVMRLVNDVLEPPYGEPLDRAMGELNRVSSEWSSRRLNIATGVVGIGYSSEASLLALHRWAEEHQTLFCIHVPTMHDATVIAKRGFAGSGIAYHEHLGVLTPATVVMKPRFDEPDWDIVARNGAAVVITPDVANYQGSKWVPMADLQRTGVRFGVGLDEPIGSPHQSMWLAMRTALLEPRRPSQREPGEGSFGSAGSPEQILMMGTSSGAEVLRFVGGGRIAPGSLADIMVFDRNGISLNPPEEMVSLLVHSAGARPAFVIADGRTVVEHGVLQVWDIRDVVQEAADAQAQIIEEAEAGGVIRRASVWNYQD